MMLNELNETIASQIEHCKRVLVIKGEEYVHGNDRLEHFKNSAQDQDITAKEALWGMLSKQLTSLKAMCKNDNTVTELWVEKITDSINYLLLLRCLVEEEVANEKYRS